MAYEDLVSAPEESLRRLFESLDLSFEAQCLEFHRERRYSPTPSYEDVNRQVTDSAVGRYRHYQNRLQPLSDRFEKLLALTGYRAEWD